MSATNNDLRYLFAIRAHLHAKYGVGSSVLTTELMPTLQGPSSAPSIYALYKVHRIPDLIWAMNYLKWPIDRADIICHTDILDLTNLIEISVTVQQRPRHKFISYAKNSKKWRVKVRGRVYGMEDTLDLAITLRDNLCADFGIPTQSKPKTSDLWTPSRLADRWELSESDDRWHAEIECQMTQELSEPSESSDTHLVAKPTPDIQPEPEPEPEPEPVTQPEPEPVTQPEPEINPAADPEPKLETSNQTDPLFELISNDNKSADSEESPEEMSPDEIMAYIRAQSGNTSAQPYAPSSFET